MNTSTYIDGLVVHYDHETNTYDVEELEPCWKERDN